MQQLPPEGSFVRVTQDGESTRYGTLVYLAPGFAGLQQRPNGPVALIIPAEAMVKAYPRRRVSVFFTASCLCDWGPCGPGWRWRFEKDGWGEQSTWRERLYASQPEALAAALGWLRAETAP